MAEEKVGVSSDMLSGLTTKSNQRPDKSMNLPKGPSVNEDATRSGVGEGAKSSPGGRTA